MKDLWLMIQDSSPTILWDLAPLRSTIADRSTTPELTWISSSLSGDPNHKPTWRDFLMFLRLLLCFSKFSISVIKYSAWPRALRHLSTSNKIRLKKGDGDKCGFSFWKYQFLHEKDRVILLWKSQSKFYYVPLLVFWTLLKTQWGSIFCSVHRV